MFLSSENNWKGFERGLENDYDIIIILSLLYIHITSLSLSLSLSLETTDNNDKIRNIEKSGAFPSNTHDSGLSQPIIIW